MTGKNKTNHFRDYLKLLNKTTLIIILTSLTLFFLIHCLLFTELVENFGATGITFSLSLGAFLVANTFHHQRLIQANYFEMDFPDYEQVINNIRNEKIELNEETKKSFKSKAENFSASIPKLKSNLDHYYNMTIVSLITCLLISFFWLITIISKNLFSLYLTCLTGSYFAYLFISLIKESREIYKGSLDNAIFIYREKSQIELVEEFLKEIDD